MAEGKDQLVAVPGNLTDPYRAKASDFSASKVSPFHGQGSDAEGEQDELMPLSMAQESPRAVERPDVEGGGDDNRSYGGNAARVGKAFKVSRNAGEGGSPATDVSNPSSLDLEDGCIKVKGINQTKVWEVPDPNLSIG